MAGTDHDQTFIGNHIFANVLTMVSTAHFDHDHDFAELPIDLDITEPDNIVGEEGDRVMAELKRVEGILDLDRGHNSHSSARQCGDHAIKGLAEVLAKAWGQRHFKPHERVDHEPFGVDFFHHVQDLLHRFIDGEIQRPKVKHFEFARFLGSSQVQSERFGPGGVTLRTFLENCRNHIFSYPNALRQELSGQR